MEQGSKGGAFVQGCLSSWRYVVQWGQIIEGKMSPSSDRNRPIGLSPMVTAFESNLIGKFGVQSCPFRSKRTEASTRFLAHPLPGRGELASVLVHRRAPELLSSPLLRLIKRSPKRSRSACSSPEPLLPETAASERLYPGFADLAP
jgi:hypothetical protein